MPVEKELIAIRKQYQITQQDLADVIERQVATYRERELGRQDFTSSEMYAIQQYLINFVGLLPLEKIFVTKHTKSVHKDD